MPVKFFKVPLSVNSKGGGETTLVPPEILKNLGYQFVIVRDDGAEGIIQLEASDPVIEEVTANQDFQPLTEDQMQELKVSYLPPKLKQKYRFRSEILEAESEIPGESYEFNEQGERIIDTVQTVRVGFHLIDVPVVSVNILD